MPLSFLSPLRKEYERDGKDKHQNEKPSTIAILDCGLSLNGPDAKANQNGLKG